MMLKKGFRVEIKETSEFYYQFTDYAKGTIGTVMSIEEDEEDSDEHYPYPDDWVVVKFDNGYSNSFPREDIIIIELTLKNILED